MNRDDALKAVNDAFDEGVRHLYAVFVAGLLTDQPATELSQRFCKGLACQCDAHGKTTAIVTDYFKGFKP